MRSKFRPLPRSFYDRQTVEVARELLGKRLLRRTEAGLTSGWIVEVEAYLAENDPACHAVRGRTRKNDAMFGPPGRAYVYSIHARYCLNVVTEPQDVPSAVLIRAVEPQEGIPLMQRRRGGRQLVELTRGPARLCEAFDIARPLNGWDLTGGDQLWIVENDALDAAASEIVVSPRIGVTSAQQLMLRFFIGGNPYVSGPRGRVGKAAPWGPSTPRE